MSAPQLLDTLIPGEIVDGRFKIDRAAGAGGMGQVYRALDRRTGRAVALKMLTLSSQDALLRFDREIQALGQLRIPGVVPYVAHGTAANGKPYLVMEWLAGCTLAERMESDGLTVSESVVLAMRVARTLGTVHRLGIVHRDVKPSNLILVEGRLDRVTLVDFGVARVGPDHHVTVAGMIVGTPEYMAPEQARADPHIDARADVFALGCVLYKCLSGRAAFEGSGALAVLAKVLLEEPPRLRELRAEIPEQLDALVARMLSKAPAGRPRDGNEVVAELAALNRRELRQAAGAAPTATRRPMELTTGERRMMCLVLAHEPAARGGAAPEEATRSEAEDQERLHQRTAALLAIAERHGGRLELIDARAPLIVLTSAAAPTDLAAQAARCALAVRALLGDASVALVTGRAEIHARFPVGELVERAVRQLSSETAPSRAAGVHTDPMTMALLGSRFDASRDGDGYRLHGANEDASKAPVLGRRTPFVGREREIAVVMSELERCVDERTAGALLVTAEAGMGKSRLREEVVERARRELGAFDVWLGYGDPMSAGSAFGLLARALRSAMGLTRGDPRAARQRVEARVARHPGLDVPRVSAFLAELVGAPYSDERDMQLGAARRNAVLMGDQLHFAWETFLRAECATRPVLLVLDDLQWGDLPTLTMVEAALRKLAKLPFFALALGRPEVEEQLPPLARSRLWHRLPLKGLSRRASERMVREALGDDASAEVVERFAERAGGSPFYLEEQIRSAAAGHTDDLPETVLAMVQARLDALDQQSRRVLRAGSVFGQSFPVAGVRELVGGAEVDDHLAALERHDVLERAFDRAQGDDAEYRFRDSLVREAAYAMLTDADRTLGHALAGEFLERTGEPDPIRLAEHFERGGLPKRAEQAYLRAARQALQGNDLGAAIERAERGVATDPGPEIAGALRLVLAEAHLWRGDLAAAEQRGVEAIERLSEGSALWFSAITHVSYAACKLGGFDRVERWMDAAVVTPAAEGAESARMTSLCAGASALVMGGRYAAVDALLAAVATSLASAPAPDVEVIATLHQARAFRAMSQGDPGACALHLKLSLDAFDRAGDRRNACIARANLGHSIGELGDFRGAEEALRSALDTAERMGLYEVAAAAQASLGHVLAQDGRLDEAHLVETAAVAASVRLGDPRAEVVSRAYLAKIALLSGDPEAAEREARIAADLPQNESPLRAVATAVRARALLDLGRTDEAVADARAAFATLEALGTLEEGESLVRVTHAEALAQSGRMAEAAAAIAAARDGLLARAARISDPAFRDRFLYRVPENVTIQTLARRLLDARGNPPA